MVEVIPAASREFQQVIDDYLCKQHGLPSDFLKRKNLVESGLIYAPAYLFTATWNVRWSAQFGNYRTERYTTWHFDHHTKQTKPHNNFRILTDWYPASGKDKGSIAVIAYAGDALPAFAQNMVGRCERTHGYLYAGEDIDAEPAVLMPDEAWEASGHPQVKAQIDHAIRRRAQGDTQKDWYWDGSTSHETTPLLIPIWRCSIRYRGATYRLWLDGETGTKIDHASLPVDWGAKAGTLAASYGPLAAVGLVLGWAQSWAFSHWVASVALLGIAGAIGRIDRIMILRSEQARARKILEEEV